MRPAWTWPRLARIAALAVAGLAALDLLLGPVEARLQRHGSDGELRNTDGMGIADACLSLIESDPARTRRAAIFVGSSVTYGSNARDDETLPAATARALRALGDPAPVYNCAQPGGGPATPVPVAASFGTRPAGLLLVEVMVPSYAARGKASHPTWAGEELALIDDADAAGHAMLAQQGYLPSRPVRIEALLSSFVRRRWRLYRLRGSLWLDDNTPNYLVWSLRRQAAAHGLLPRRFQGQTTNVGRLPWREAYAGRTHPSALQRFRVPEAALDEAAYAHLRSAFALARGAGVPVLFYEVPLNLSFQRAFHLMSEEELARLERVRTLLLERMAADGMALLPAPEVPEDAFLDKAHLTPSGADRVGAWLAPRIDAVLRKGEPAS